MSTTLEFQMTKVKPVPDGYHTFTPYLIVNGAPVAKAKEEVVFAK